MGPYVKRDSYGQWLNSDQQGILHRVQSPGCVKIINCELQIYPSLSVQTLMSAEVTHGLMRALQTPRQVFGPFSAINGGTVYAWRAWQTMWRMRQIDKVAWKSKFFCCKGVYVHGKNHVQGEEKLIDCLYLNNIKSHAVMSWSMLWRTLEDVILIKWEKVLYLIGSLYLTLNLTISFLNFI